MPGLAVAWGSPGGQKKAPCLSGGPSWGNPLAMDSRITRNPLVMGGKPCLRGMRITVGTITGLLAAGHGVADILRMYPYLEAEDISAALFYATRLAEAYDAELQVA